MHKYLPYGIALATLCIALSSYALYASDWRLGENWLPTRTGSIRIEFAGDVSMFLDNRKIERTSDTSTVLSKVIPGLRTVLVAKEGSWPWTKQVVVEGGKTFELRPFTIPLTPEAEVLTKEDAEYQEAKQYIAAWGLPTNAKPLLSPDQLIELYIENEHVRARWVGPEQETPLLFCEGPCGAIDIFKPDKSEIRDIAFFRDRSDVIIVAVTNGVFALDLNPVGTQNFQPLYLGAEPTFAPGPSETIYIQDQGFYIHLKL